MSSAIPRYPVMWPSTARMGVTDMDTHGTTMKFSYCVAENEERIEVFITNTHATQTLSLSLGGTAVAGSGIVLRSNESVVISSFTGAINAIGSGAATTVAIAEV